MKIGKIRYERFGFLTISDKTFFGRLRLFLWSSFVTEKVEPIEVDLISNANSPCLNTLCSLASAFRF